MKYPVVLCFVLIVIGLIDVSGVQGQTALTVAETTIRVDTGKSFECFYAFCQGDKIEVSLKVKKGKALKYVEVTEYPGSLRYSATRVRRIGSKKLDVPATGIYSFSLVNNTTTAATVYFAIRRIPADSLCESFSTAVQWRTVYDTTFASRKEYGIIKSDTVIYNIVDQTAKVHSRTNLNGCRSTFRFSLPRNTVAWSYYLGVDQEGQEEFEKATALVAKYGGKVVSQIPGYGPLAALALGGVSYLTKLQSGEDVEYYIVRDGQEENFLDDEEFLYIKKGEVINDFSRMDNPLSGSLHFCFYNDNAIMAILVSVKIAAVVVNNTYGTKTIRDMVITPRREPYIK